MTGSHSSLEGSPDRGRAPERELVRAFDYSGDAPFVVSLWFMEATGSGGKAAVGFPKTPGEAAAVIPDGKVTVLLPVAFYAFAGVTSWAIDQTNPANSLAIAVTVTCLRFPLAWNFR